MRRFLLLISVTSMPPALADGPITLAEAQARVLAASPSLAARAAAIRAAEGAVLQARALPNPVVLLEAEDFGGGLGYDGAQTTLSLEQTIETGGKRGARTAVAERAQEAAALDLAAQRTQLLAETARRATPLAEKPCRFEPRSRQSRSYSDLALFRLVPAERVDPTVST